MAFTTSSSRWRGEIATGVSPGSPPPNCPPIAVAHSLLTVLYHVLTRAEPYRELGGDYFDRRKPEQQARYYARRWPSSASTSPSIPLPPRKPAGGTF